MWDKTIKNGINAKIKASQQPLSDIQKIDPWYLWEARLVKAEEKLVDNKDPTKSSHHFFINLRSQLEHSFLNQVSASSSS